MNAPWHTSAVPDAYDNLAPDGSEIRRLARADGGSLVHCTLRPGQVSRAVRHRGVEEVWFFLGGAGRVWRQRDGVEEITDVRAGLALTIPPGTHFQFRAVGSEPLVFVVATMPPWPGVDEAVMVSGVWPTEL